MAVPLRKGQVRDVRIDDLAFGGKGVGRVEGFVVLVDGAVPGDLARVRFDKVRGSYAEGRALELVEPSPDRVPARCEHFGVCGGCRWQNLPYDLQLDYKRRQVIEALRRIGGVAEPPVEPTLPSPDPYFYRNKMEFSFGRDAGGTLTLGLHPAASYMEVFDLRRCHLQSDLSNEIVAAVREGCRAAGMPPYDVKKHTGFLRYLTVREGKVSGEVMVNLVTASGGEREAEWAAALAALARHIVADHPQIKSFLRSLNTGRATVAFGEREEVLSGAASIRETLLERTFEITANSFFQTNSKQAVRLYGAVLEMADLTGEDRVLDLYSGTGAISILAAARAAEVRGVESLAESVRNAERNASLNHVRNVYFICGEARKALAALAGDRRPPTVIIANPPRAGLNSAVIRSMLRLRPRRMIYVSCNPTTLARDVQEICERDYRLEQVRPVDMFPHTWHIECVARIERTGAVGPATLPDGVGAPD
ncbi:MAG TPA: 23S rRNA (uracil(1939)-C(5))-methyltransferase RlmD [Candidatus Polarisedimenticolia bacterium]|nr:23S rRNA (uracil(1939)-C(5))-methyltransferase RlmD [Candidatus Polarisedimenticolia bacterium]